MLQKMAAVKVNAQQTDTVLGGLFLRGNRRKSLRLFQYRVHNAKV